MRTLFTLVGFIAIQVKQYGSSISRVNAIWSVCLLRCFSYDKRTLVTAVAVCIMALVSKEDGIEPLKEITTLKSESTLLALELAPQLWSMAHFAPLEVTSPALSKNLLELVKIKII